MQHPKPIFRIDRRPIAKVDCMVIGKTSVGYLGMAPCPDIDGDGVVGASDRILVSNALGQSYLVSPKTDLDMNGTTSQSDLITVTGLMGQYIPIYSRLEDWARCDNRDRHNGDRIILFQCENY